MSHPSCWALSKSFFWSRNSCALVLGNFLLFLWYCPSLYCLGSLRNSLGSGFFLEFLIWFFLFSSRYHRYLFVLALEKFLQLYLPTYPFPPTHIIFLIPQIFFLFLSIYLLNSIPNMQLHLISLGLLIIGFGFSPSFFFCCLQKKIACFHFLFSCLLCVGISFSARDFLLDYSWLSVHI